MIDGRRVEIGRNAALKSVVGAARHRLTGHRMALNVTLVVTRRCSALCSYCSSPMQPARELETWEIFGLIDGLAAQGMVRLGLTGGEPLLRDDIGQIVDRCTQLGVWTTLESNGYDWPARADELRNLNRLMISLDGDEAVHDQMREVGGWARAVTAIDDAVRRGHDVVIITTLTKHNAEQVEWVVDFAEEHGVSVVFQLLQPTGPIASRGAPRLMASDAQLRNALQKALDAQQAGRPVAMSEKTLRYLLTWPDFRTPNQAIPHEDVLCMAGQVYCAIDADGGVYPCINRAPSEPVGNIRTDGFAAAFAKLLEPPCRACTSTPCTEYNFLYNLNGPRVVELARSLAPRPRGAP